MISRFGSGRSAPLHSRRVRTIIVLLVFAGIIAAGAIVAVVVLRSDDDNVNPSAAAWANSVCADIDDWRTTVTSLADVSGGTLTKDALRRKLEDGRKATDDLVTKLRDLGPPDLESGDELKDKLNADADDLRTSYDSLSSKAQDALDASSVTGFLGALASLGTPFQNLVNRISTTLEDLRNADIRADARAELQRAFDDADACKKLRSQD
jgi:hypothetical protein